MTAEQAPMSGVGNVRDIVSQLQEVAVTLLQDDEGDLDRRLVHKWYPPRYRAVVGARDRAVEAWAKHRPGTDVFEDRDLEITSYMDIDVEDQVHAVSKALLKRT